MRKLSAAILSLTLVLAPVAFTVLPVGETDQSRAPKTKPLPKSVLDQIEKCDRAQTSCNAACDKNIIDVDNQVELCKQKCGRERALCSMMRTGPRTGVTGVTPASPPGATRN
jgi:hypothetical protein